jgi:hypothetical protein
LTDAIDINNEPSKLIIKFDILPLHIAWAMHTESFNPPDCHPAK